MPKVTTIVNAPRLLLQPLKPHTSTAKPQLNPPPSLCCDLLTFTIFLLLLRRTPGLCEAAAGHSRLSSRDCLMPFSKLLMPFLLQIMPCFRSFISPKICMSVGNEASKALCNLEKQWCLENGTRWPQEDSLAQTAASSHRLGVPASNGRKMVKVNGGIWDFAEWCWHGWL